MAFKNIEIMTCSCFNVIIELINHRPGDVSTTQSAPTSRQIVPLNIVAPVLPVHTHTRGDRLLRLSRGHVLSLILLPVDQSLACGRWQMEASQVKAENQTVFSCLSSSAGANVPRHNVSQSFTG